MDFITGNAYAYKPQIKRPNRNKIKYLVASTMHKTWNTLWIYKNACAKICMCVIICERMCAKIKSEYHPFTITCEHSRPQSETKKTWRPRGKGREEPVSASERVKMTLSNFLFFGGWGWGTRAHTEGNFLWLLMRVFWQGGEGEGRGREGGGVHS